MADEPTAPSEPVAPQSFDWKGFCQNTWVIVIGGILFPPVGMILTWLKPGWSTRTKWIATGVLCLLLIGRNQPKKERSGQEEQPPASAQASDADDRSVEVVRTTPSRQMAQEMPAAQDAAASLPQDTVTLEKTIPPMPDLTSRVRRGWTESERAYRDRIFNRTVVAVLEHYYEVPCTPGAWTPIKTEAPYGTPTEYQVDVTRADGKRVHVRLRNKEYQFVWAAYEGGTAPHNAIGYWLRDGRTISAHAFDIFKGDVAQIADATSSSDPSERRGEASSSRQLPQVKRAAWGPTTLPDAKRYVLVDDPQACKGKEYKMEVKYRGGGTRNSNGTLEDIECDVWTGGSFFQMEFSFPPDVKQPNIKPGDYLNISFVFSGATKSFFNNPNVVTAVERPDH